MIAKITPTNKLSDILIKTQNVSLRKVYLIQKGRLQNGSYYIQTLTCHPRDKENNKGRMLPSGMIFLKNILTKLQFKAHSDTLNHI